MPRIDIQLAADYICFKAFEAGERISVLKLQKLLYYVQAWSEAIFNEPIFVDEFEAWVHGPVSKAVFMRYRGVKTMYEPIEKVSWEASIPKFASIPEQVRDHIDNVLNSYMPLSGSQLEQLSHQETPWINARAGLEPFARCDRAIKAQDMREFYSRMIQRQ